MSAEEILKEIEQIFEEEKYSKFQLSEYNLTKFKKIDKVIEKIKKNELQKKAVKIAEECLKKNEFSLITKYFISYFSFTSDHDVFLQGFTKIINNFIERQKWSIVEFISDKMLSLEENEFGLRSHINSLKMLNKTKAIPPLQEKLLKLNPDDHAIAINIAKFYEAENKKEEAIKNYKLALKLFINRKNQKMVEELWLKILEITENPLPIFYETENALKSNFTPEFIVTLSGCMINNLSKLKKYDEVIYILKKILSLQQTNKEYREELIKIYRLKYIKHSRLEDLLRASGLRMWWKDINPAVELFEKQIKFDVGVFVYHYSWGTGKVSFIDKDQITVDFDKKHDHSMSFEMALNTLEIVTKDHIKVKKRYELDDLKDMSIKSPIKLIDVIINSYKKKEITVDALKEEVTDKIINISDWQRWWVKVRKMLKTHPNLKLLETEKLIKFMDSDTSYGDIILVRFEEASEFLEKIKIVNELLKNDINKKVKKDIYQQVTNYLIEFTNNQLSSKPELAYISAIILKSIKLFNSKVSIKKLNYDHHYIINSVDNIADLFKHINILEYKKSLISDVKKTRDDWEKILFELLFTEESKLFESLIEILSNNKKNDIIKNIIDKAIDKYRDYPELFYYISKNIFTKTFDTVIQSDFILRNKIFQNLFFLLSYSGRQVKNKISTDYYNKIQKQIIRLLFDKQTNYFLNFIKKSMDNNDLSSILNLFKENEYIPKKYRENTVAELRSLEKSIVF